MGDLRKCILENILNISFASLVTFLSLIRIFKLKVYWNIYVPVNPLQRWPVVISFCASMYVSKHKTTSPLLTSVNVKYNKYIRRKLKPLGGMRAQNLYKRDQKLPIVKWWFCITPFSVAFNIGVLWTIYFDATFF